MSGLPEWDGVDRIEQLSICLDLEGDEKEEFSKRRKLEFFLSKAIKRWMTGEHGICLVIASEKQGIGKSTFFKWLCPVETLFKRRPVNPDNKDDRLAQASTMLWEIEELGATTRRKDVESLKSFLSCEEIDERKSYARQSMKKKAHCVFVGTTNDVSGFLVDSENRRFMALRISHIDFGYEKIDKTQLWSQALACLKDKKDVLNFAERECQREENKDFRMETSLEIKIREYFDTTENPDDFVPSEELLNCLLEAKIPTRGNEIAIVMAALGCPRIRKRCRYEKNPKWGYSGIAKKSAMAEIPKDLPGWRNV